MMNSDVMNEQSLRLAERLLTNIQRSRAAKGLYAIAFGRSPTEPEVARALSFVERYRTSRQPQAL